jgi:hypothetical protein
LLLPGEQARGRDADHDAAAHRPDHDPPGARNRPRSTWATLSAFGRGTGCRHPAAAARAVVRASPIVSRCVRFVMVFSVVESVLFAFANQRRRKNHDGKTTRTRLLNGPCPNPKNFLNRTGSALREPELPPRPRDEPQ